MANAFTPEQLTEAIRKLSVDANANAKVVEQLQSDVTDLEDSVKDLQKKVNDLSKKK